MNIDKVIDALVEVILFTDEPECMDYGDTEPSRDFRSSIEHAFADKGFYDELDRLEEEWGDHEEFPTEQRLGHYLWYVGQGHGISPFDDIQDPNLCEDIEYLASVLDTEGWETWTEATLHLDIH